MVNGTILPFPAAGALKAPQRPLPPAAAHGDDFAGAMDGALEPSRPARRDATGARAPRRLDAARPSESARNEAAASIRKAANPGKTVSAKKADRTEASEETAAEPDTQSSTETAPAADSSAPELQAKADPDSDGPCCDTPAEAAESATEAVAGAGAVATDAAALVTDGADDAATEAVEDPARGRRWNLTAAEPAGDHETRARNGTTRIGARAPIPSAQQPGPQAKRQQIEAATTTGEMLAEMAQHAALTAKGDRSAGATAKAGPVTQAIETATATPQTASAADAATAIENAVAAVESVAAVETSAGTNTNTGDTETREQAQPKPQAPTPQANISEAAAAVGTSDGVRFTVNGATGNAAYANAAPRHEEPVLPQIVRSIRLHAVQGTTEARVQLKPEHLGALNITLKVEQNQVTATIQADVAAVRSWIQSNEASLRQALSEQGLHLARLVVHEDGQQASRDQQDDERPRRQPRRRSWRDEGATFEVMV